MFNCDHHGSRDCPAQQELDGLDTQIDMRLKAELEVKAMRVMAREVATDLREILGRLRHDPS